MSDREMLKEDLIDAIVRLDDEEVHVCVHKLLELGISFQDIQNYLNQGMKLVGKLFESGEYFIADLMYSGMLYRSVLDILPHNNQSLAGEKKGRILIGVVENDIHDIGKDIVVGILASDGFDVIDLGINVASQAFVEAIRTHHPQIVIMSGMMDFAQDAMKQALTTICEAGLRDQVFILLGGGCIDPTILKRISADAAATDPTDTLNICNTYINRR